MIVVWVLLAWFATTVVFAAGWLVCSLCMASKQADKHLTE